MAQTCTDLYKTELQVMQERHILTYQEQVKQEKVKHKTSTSNIASGDVTHDCIPDSDDDSESVKIMSTEIPEQPRTVNDKNNNVKSKEGGSGAHHTNKWSEKRKPKKVLMI